jgi:hypothetical protein
MKTTIEISDALLREVREFALFGRWWSAGFIV